MWLNLLIASGVLIGLMGLWVAVHWWLSPHVDSPDAEARVEGSCGDSMEMRVKFEDNRVADISYWTNGCTYMVNCLSAATHLAKGKTLDEVAAIDADVVQKSIGGLPEDYMHCATQAAELLRGVVEDFLSKQRQGSRAEYSTSRLTCNRLSPLDKRQESR